MLIHKIKICFKCHSTNMSLNGSKKLVWKKKAGPDGCRLQNRVHEGSQ